MASSAFRPLQETRCKLQFRRSFNAPSASTVHAFIPRFSLFIHLEAKLPPRNTIRYSIASDRNRTGFSSARRGGQSTGSVVEDNVEGRVLLKDRERGPKPSSMRSKGGGRMRNSSTKTQDSDNGRRMGRNSNKNKDESPENMLRVGLDMCSKTGDVAGAIRLYDMSRREEVKLGKYHYAVLLYLCSSAAAGVVQPAKSGSGSRKLTSLGLSNEVTDTDSDCSIEPQENTSFSISQLDSDSVVVRSDGRDFPDGVLEPYPESLNGMVELLKSNADKMKINGGERRGSGIEISEDVKKYALQRGFEIYESMLSEKVPMNEATFTSVARMAMALGDGDMAFEIVKQMAESGESPKLRSYGPALSVFCNNGDVEKAFMVEKHMLDQGICPEEPELEALLKASVEAGRGDKVYDLLQKLRTSVRQVLPSTADLIEKWFRSNVASKVGKKKFSQKMITDAIRNGGGGWHGLGWLGKGIWTVSHTSVGSDGFCSCCGEKLVTIDLDPVETEEFAKSVASLALEREKHSSFEKFQKWLDYYGPFEAVVDAANIGLYSQRSFRPSKVNAVVNGIRQVLPSKRWPLIVLHNRRISGDPKMNEPMNKGLIEKWQNADALYATPTGSNDDWYWLYAAIKFRGLLVTNDEMRDHLFQLLGKDFFPKWKERHQVRFSFSETGPVFHMPPPCSVVIQESEKGHWHIPIASESISHGERVWLCITRTPSLASNPKSSIRHDVMETRNVESNSHAPQKGKKGTSSGIGKKSEPSEHSNCGNRKEAPQETYRNLTSILSSSLLSDCSNSVLQDLDDAEGFGGCTIDYQI